MYSIIILCVYIILVYRLNAKRCCAAIFLTLNKMSATVDRTAFVFSVAMAAHSLFPPIHVSLAELEIVLPSNKLTDCNAQL